MASLPHPGAVQVHQTDQTQLDGEVLFVADPAATVHCVNNNFRKFESFYYLLGLLSMPTITNITGCPAPCSFKEYKEVGDPIVIVSNFRIRNNKSHEVNIIF